MDNPTTYPGNGAVHKLGLRASARARNRADAYEWARVRPRSSGSDRTLARMSPRTAERKWQTRRDLLVRGELPGAYTRDPVAVAGSNVYALSSHIDRVGRSTGAITVVAASMSVSGCWRERMHGRQGRRCSS